MSVKAIFEQIEYQSPQKCFEVFASTQGNMLVDSADGAREAYGTNRYSYILIDPFDCYTYHSSLSHAVDPLMVLRDKCALFTLEPIVGLPPFQGGVAGYLSYDLAHIYHSIARPLHNDLDYPEISMAFYDLVCSFDHVEQKAYIVSSGFPEANETRRLQRAQERLDWFKHVRLVESQAADQKICSIALTEIKSNFTPEHYLDAAHKMIEYIRSGDIFEANLTQRFSAQLPDAFDHYMLYKKLSVINPSPFAAFLNLGAYKIISASPERFISIRNRHVETRPIKGTRARRENPIEDALAADDLLTSEKDFAENIMIVDLMRNDLSIVCEDDSVVVEQLCAHEIYPTVHHLVSVITGTLKADEDAFSALKAMFPGGSITGAPKIRAMQIIAEIEPDPRGPYCGSIVLIGFDGTMDSSILIRTFVIKDDLITFHAGGAIVIDSNPLDEYEETLSKSYALHKALSNEVL